MVKTIPEVNKAENVTSAKHPLGGVELEIWLHRGGFIDMKYYAEKQ